MDVGELVRGGGRIPASMLEKLDEQRRGKVLSAKTPQGRAAQLGAGLLLQKIAQREANPAESVRARKTGQCERAAEASGIALPARTPRVLRYGVRDLLADLGEPLLLTYRYGENGKPYFENAPCFFNLSHSGEYVLCAASDREVGADIQQYRPANVRRLAERFFARRECRSLEQCGSDEERRELFFTLWSRKEAYGKLTGEGAAAALGQDMGSVCVEWMDVPPLKGYAMALCRFPEETPEASQQGGKAAFKV